MITVRTLSESLLASCNPVSGEGGNAVRAYCPFHGSDHQRSLHVDLVTGRFKCFACDAWGYLEGHRRRHPMTRAHVARRRFFGLKTSAQEMSSLPATRVLPEPQPLLPAILAEYKLYQKALPGSCAEAYLAKRGIPLHLALRYGIGYAMPGTWAHRDRMGRPVRQWWHGGRVVFAETNPQGDIVNLYGRAVGDAPREKAHDHLPSPKGWFNAEVIRQVGDGPLFITEGVFDALSLIAAEYWQTVAIIGINGIRWTWLAPVSELVIAFDADETGQAKARDLVRQAVLRGKTARVLPPECYGGCKDPAEAWQAGVLDVAGWC